MEGTDESYERKLHDLGVAGFLTVQPGQRQAAAVRVDAYDAHLESREECLQVAHTGDSPVQFILAYFIAFVETEIQYEAAEMMFVVFECLGYVETQIWLLSWPHEVRRKLNDSCVQEYCRRLRIKHLSLRWLDATWPYEKLVDCGFECSWSEGTP